MIVTLTLNPSLDYVMEPGSLLLGEVNRSRQEQLYPGGKGINVSLILRRMGMESRCMGFVAGETGKLLSKELTRWEIVPEFLPLSTGFTRINVKLQCESGVTEINGSGPQPGPADWQALWSRLEGLNEGDVLAVAGRISASAGQEFFSGLEQICRKGVRLAVDCSGKVLRRLLKYAPLVAKPNLAELEELCGRGLPSQQQQIEAACQFWRCGNPCRYGAQHLLLSLGAQGALLFFDDGRGGTVLYLPAPSGKVVNPVGAGDSMLAGCLAGLQRGLPAEEILSLAVGWGSATAFSQWLAETPVATQQVQTILERRY